MKTYLRHHSLKESEVRTAYERWTKSRSGHKNGCIVTEEYGDADSLVAEIYREVTARSLSFAPLRYFERIEPTNGKVRTIGVQSVKQQVCDYLVIGLLQPMLDARIGRWQCASIPGRGQVMAAKKLKEWYAEGGYFAKMDIRKCYPSVDQAVLKRLLRKYVGSEDVLYIADCILGAYGTGLNIGSYFSQYMANFVVSFIYHYIEELHKERRGKRKALVKHQMWYMDDLFAQSRDKRDITSALRLIEAYMRDELGLTAKLWKVCECGADKLDMVGYVQCPDGRMLLRKGTWKRSRRAFARQSRAPCLKRAQRCTSYWGQLKWCDSPAARRYAKVTRQSRKMISNHDRQRRV